MKKTKNEKKQNNGITLISLVITIIIMLILVGVSINLAVNGGLFDYAGKAVGDTKNALNQEQELIDDIIENHINPNVSGIKSYEKAKKTSNNGYLTEKAKYKTATIPEGYKILNEGTEIEDGLVIADSNGNEFVWIPVEKAIITENEIETLKVKYEVTSNTEAVAKLANEEGIYPMAVEVTEQDSEGKTVTNYKGILYNFSGTDQLTVTVYDWTNREPANLSEEYDNITNLGSEWNDETFQKAYNKMVESVEENGGFYVGRYEISEGIYTLGEENTVKYAQSQAGKNALISTTWYDMYKCESNYAKYNENLGVTSEMIWGSQWDQMMIFVNGKYDGAETPTKFYVTSVSTRYLGSRFVKTGANNKDKVQNIFDLEASYREWTQEALAAYNYRTHRGENNGEVVNGSKYSVSYRGYGKSTSTWDKCSSRLSLYIK